MKLSIVIPCYNEASTIEQVLIAVRATKYEKEVIVVDDCSTDQTQHLLKNELAGLVDIYIRHQNNLGKGAALKSGFKSATGDLVLIQDSDLEYDPNDYPLLVEPFIHGRADAVYGSRYIGSRPHRALGFRQHVANNFLTFLCNLCNEINLTDMETGYKVFRRQVIQQIELHEKGFGFEPEVTAKLARMGARIIEVGISFYGRTYEEGKKIKIQDGLHAIWCILKYSFFAPSPAKLTKT